MLSAVRQGYAPVSSSTCVECLREAVHRVFQRSSNLSADQATRAPCRWQLLPSALFLRSHQSSKESPQFCRSFHTSRMAQRMSLCRSVRRLARSPVEHPPHGKAPEVPCQRRCRGKAVAWLLCSWSEVRLRQAVKIPLRTDALLAALVESCRTSCYLFQSRPNLSKRSPRITTKTRPVWTSSHRIWLALVLDPRSVPMRSQSRSQRPDCCTPSTTKT